MKLSRNLLAMVLLSFAIVGVARDDWRVITEFSPLEELVPPAVQQDIKGAQFVFMLPDGEPLENALDSAMGADWHKAAKWLLPLAKQGSAAAQFLLAEMLYEGVGVKQNSKQAAKEYKKAAELLLPLTRKGNAAAQFLLAAMFDDGLGVKQDFQQAVKWYKKAAQQGLAQAQYNLAMMYHQGKGVAQDYQQARKWLKKSAEQYNNLALMVLGGYYLEGLGVPKDQQKAKKYFEQACEAGADMGCRMGMELEEK
ncbi:tetratricopeptide repeat protein [Avibacterium avium]|uniref:tetratricopeptide repeat protein n=1 Tax=Avibacterium avium TaxID=751 RepID=UPI003BF8FAC5